MLMMNNKDLGMHWMTLVMDILLSWMFFFYCTWQKEHLWIPSLDTPSLDMGELQAKMAKSADLKHDTPSFPLMATVKLVNSPAREWSDIQKVAFAQPAKL